MGFIFLFDNLYFGGFFHIDMFADILLDLHFLFHFLSFCYHFMIHLLITLHIVFIADVILF